MRIVQERSFESGKDVIIDRYTEGEEDGCCTSNDVKEWLLETLRGAVIVSIEYTRDLREEETLTVVFITGEAVPDFKMTKKKERADRKAVRALIKEERKAVR